MIFVTFDPWRLGRSSSTTLFQAVKFQPWRAAVSGKMQEEPNLVVTDFPPGSRPESNTAISVPPGVPGTFCGQFGLTGGFKVSTVELYVESNAVILKFPQKSAGPFSPTTPVRGGL